MGADVGADVDHPVAAPDALAEQCDLLLEIFTIIAERTANDAVGPPVHHQTVPRLHQPDRSLSTQQIVRYRPFPPLHRPEV
ncbi:hypothetical protein [Azospirillum sp. TSA6c]|uniref:hypothetical protein n=1 Tax=Azospirillum sp. TSA6c TaxID=709813 RepID=UPI001FFE9977|nr:hypothetical protein [Azospirillum sp. TSA6c]